MRTQKRQKEGCDSGNGSERGRLSRVFEQLESGESLGLLHVINENMEELDTQRQAIEEDETDEDDDGFEPTEEVPTHFSGVDSGNLITTAEVNNALKREENEESRTATEEVAVMKGGLRSRMRRHKEKRKQKKKKQEEVAGIFGTSGKPPRWSLSHYLQSVASTREKRVVAVCAWLLALIGLIIALVFVTKDFVDSRAEMASTVRYEEEDVMNVPSLWVCSADTGLPHFENLPSKEYKGQPLLWVDFVRGSSSMINLTYPETKLLPQLSVISVDKMGRRCKGKDILDPSSFTSENLSPPACFYCIAISRNPPITIVEDEDGDEEGRSGPQSPDVDDGHLSDHDPRNRLSLRFARHLVFSSCRKSQLGLSGNAFRFLVYEMERHNVALVERGTLDFDGLNATDSRHRSYLWPQYRFAYRNSTIDFAVFDVVDMLCNVYLFSGYFYPTTGGDIRFKFDAVTNRWSRSGKGPFYPKEIEGFYETWGAMASVKKEEGRGIGMEQQDGGAVYPGQSVVVMTNESRRGGAETIESLEAQDMASVRLRRQVVLGRESFTRRVFLSKLRKAEVASFNQVFYLEVRYDSLLTRVVSDQMTVSWSAFIADFFGLTSLFLDVSVYTLIVAPMVVRARKKALVARKMRRRGEAAV